jgi:Smg protein
MRIFTDSERARLPSDCRGYLLSLERTGILSPQQREIVIERLLALDPHSSLNEELDVSQLKWVVLMVLSSQPGEELACSRMEDLVFDLAERPH